MPKPHHWFFYLSALEGAAATAALFLIPSEGGNLSLARLALIGFTLSIALACVLVGRRDPQILARLARPPFIVLSAVFAVSFGLALFLLRYVDPQDSFSTYVRLSPVLWYLLAFSVQIFLLCLLISRGFHPANLSSLRPTFYLALGIFCVLLILLLVIAVTRLGLIPDPAYWGEPGVPIAGWQLMLALLGGVFVAVLPFFVSTRQLDLVLPLGMYLLALALWLRIPADVLANSFYMPINPPTFQPFPYSDAGYYDQMAHSLLIGHPYLGEIPTRPLYIVLLTVLHMLFGENYRTIIFGQTVVLALIPVVFYLLGKKLHSRAAGVLIALFFIFREFTTLMVSSNTRVSNTKTLMADLPTLLLLLVACFFTIRWLEHKTKISALLAGGTFGLLLLLRTQSMLVLPLILLVAVLLLGWKSRSFYLLSSIFFLGLLVTVLPWLTHNYLQIGQFAFDSPFQYKIIASQYAYSGNLDIENYDFEGKGLGTVLIEFALQDPGFVFGFIANHFLATQIHALLALPLIKPFPGLFEPVNLYWMDWNGSLEWYNLLLLIAYLFVIAIGLGCAWRRWRWIGLLPLAFSGGYALATAVGRFSGWRYDLPADWIAYFYFGIGLAEIFFAAALLLGTKEERLSPATPGDMASKNPSERLQIIFALVLLAFLGALPWMMEKISSARYADQSPQILQGQLAALPETPTADAIKAFAVRPGTFLQAGRVVYPRFFSRQDGLASANPWPAYAVRDYPRMGFLLLNDNSAFVVFPTRRLPEFPHAEDAIILGCDRGLYIEARWVAFPVLGKIYTSEMAGGPCSP